MAAPTVQQQDQTNGGHWENGKWVPYQGQGGSTNASGAWAPSQASLNYLNPQQAQRGAPMPTQAGASGSPWPGQGVGQLTLRNNQTGQTQVIDASDHNAVDAATRSGWTPLNTEGQPYGMADYGGGQMFNNPTTGEWNPLNTILGGGPMTAEQQAAMPDFMRSLQGPPGVGGGPSGANNPRPYNPAGGVPPYGLDQPDPQMPAGIPSIDLPAPDTINPMFSDQFRGQYAGDAAAATEKIGNFYDYQTPHPEAAQIDTNAIPQGTAVQQTISPEIMRMLSGEGYSPDILAQMKAGAIDSTSSAGRTEMAQAKRAMQQAGISGSPAGAAVSQDVARRTGIEQTSALRDVNLQNANTGMENFRQGVGYQTGIGQSNMQAANAMALENANRLFAGMSQNIANTQQANMGYAANETSRLGTKAGAQTDAFGQSIGAYQGAALQKAGNADVQNVGNRNQWMLNQAQLERDRQTKNQNALEGRWTTAATGLPSWTPVPGSSYQNPQSINPFS